MAKHQLKVGLAQIAPVWLNRDATLDKVISYINEAAAQNVELIAFGEALVPGYPFWIALTDGARWDAADQKEIHAHYMDQAVQ
ncbi:MAG: carbon-nitrogen hydrolase family protein, partial [Kordiimonadaceae bacterium]|nr:carbon-nitrogen hydrolase family protein [Kordiimonadaceae bacterium]